MIRACVSTRALYAHTAFVACTDALQRVVVIVIHRSTVLGDFVLQRVRACVRELSDIELVRLGFPDVRV